MWPLALSDLAPRKTSARRHPAFRRSSARPRLEALEDRCLLSGGALDPTFGNNGIVQTPPIPGSLDDEADRVFVLANAQLMVVGITQQPGDYAITISKYQANGSLDTTFNSAGPVPGTVITGLTSPSYIAPGQLADNVACGPDGSIIIGWGNSGPGINEVTRYGPDGSLDTTFDNNAIAAINGFFPRAFGVQSDGKILITGIAILQQSPGIADTVLERLNTDGSPDLSFGTGGRVITNLGSVPDYPSPWFPGDPLGYADSEGNALAIQPDGTILVAGDVTPPGTGVTEGFVARFRADGSLDTSFHSGGVAVLVDTKGNYAVGPSAVDFRGQGPGGEGGVGDPITSITLQADGKMLVYDGGNGTYLRLNPDGTLDSGFAQTANGENGFIYGGGVAIVVDGDGRLLIEGAQSDPATGFGDFTVGSFTPDGSGPDLTFGNDGAGDAVIPIGVDSYANGAAVQSNGDIVAVGDASTDGGVSYHVALVRLLGGAMNVTTQAAVTSQVNQIVNTAVLSGQPDQVTFQVSSQLDVNTMLAAINALAPASSDAPTVTVTLDLGGGTYSTGGVTVNSPAANVNFVIQNGTLDPSYPALTVASGQVSVLNCTLLTTGDAPTILVTGGSLTLRNDVIQESTGFTDAAISVTGGTVDLGTTASPGGNTLNVNGAGAFVHNTTSNPIAAVGDTFTVIGIPLTPSSLSGFVFEDFNDDGQLDFGENGISGVKTTLTGTDDLGNAVNLSQLTDSDGAYVFLNLRPGNYYLTEAQPAGYLQGIDSVGTAGGSLAATDQFFVQLGVEVNGLNYNYGEQPTAGGSVQHGQTAGIGFWNNKNGQALIKSLNGGTGHQLGDWLAATLPHIFGASAGSSDLAGQNNAYIAALFQSDFLLKGVKLDAQVLATALSVYVTNATLDPTQVAAKYGFTVSGDGAGTATVNVGGNGDALGVANNTTLTIMDLLLATDAQAVNGVLCDGNTTKRNEANNVFSAVNQAGGIS